MRQRCAHRLFSILASAFCVSLVLLSVAVAQSESPPTAESESPATDPANVVPTPSFAETVPLRDRPLLFVSEISSDDLLNVRRSPNTSAAIISQLEAGTWALPELERAAPSPDNGDIEWIKTWVCGEEGWLAARFVTAQPRDFPGIQDLPFGIA